MIKGKRLYHTLFLFLAFFSFSGYLFIRFLGIDPTLDINVHDTYFVIGYTYIFPVLSLWFILCSLGYWILFKVNILIIKWLFWVHFAYSILFILSYPLPHFRLEPFMEYIKLHRFLDSTEVITILAFPIGQIVYFLNVLLSTLKSKQLKDNHHLCP